MSGRTAASRRDEAAASTDCYGAGRARPTAGLSLPVTGRRDSADESGICGSFDGLARVRATTVDNAGIFIEI